MTHAAKLAADNQNLRPAYPWVTCFLDILGWSRELLRYDDTIQYRDDLVKVSQTISAPINKLELLRIAVEKFDMSDASCVRDRSPKLSEQLAAMAPEARAVFEAGLSPRFTLHSYGDSFILNSPWGPDPVHKQALASTNVRTLFLQVASTVLLELAVHVPLRGAVEIGIGTEYIPRGGSEPKLISASIAKAYYLEQHVANHLRIVIGRDLLTWLRGCARQSGSSILERIARDQARGVLALCAEEPDGTVSLDYLSPDVIGTDGLTDRETVAMAYTFVDDALGRARVDGVSRLVQIYEPARAYFERRLGPLAQKVWPPGCEPR